MTWLEWLTSFGVKANQTKSIIDVPLEEANAYFAKRIKQKFAVWIIEGAWLSHKKQQRMRLNAFREWEEQYKISEQKYVKVYK